MTGVSLFVTSCSKVDSVTVVALLGVVAIWGRVPFRELQREIPASAH
jgi:hypothetical protein